VTGNRGTSDSPGGKYATGPDAAFLFVARASQTSICLNCSSAIAEALGKLPLEFSIVSMQHAVGD
jgi:hypothetical protein